MTEKYLESNISDIKVLSVKGAGVSIATQFFGLIFHTIGVIVLARLLTPKDFGLVAMVTAFSIWFMNFGINGFTEFIIQKQLINKNEISSIFWLHLFIATFLALCFTYFGFFLVNFYAETALSGISAALATSFILQALSTTHFSLLKREMKFTLVAITGLVAVILSVVLSIAAAVAGMTYWAVVVRQLIIVGVPVIAAWILCPWRPGSPRYLSNALPGLKYALHVYCNFSLGYLMKNIDKVLLGKFHGPVLLGNYDRALHLSSMPADQLLTPLHNVVLATLSRLKSDKERFIVYYTKAVSTVTFIGTLIAVVLTLSARDLILLLLGSEWSEAGLVVMALGPGIAAMFVYSTNPWLHLSLGTPDRWMRWNILALVLTTITFIIAVPFGAVAMAIAYSARAYILMIPALWYAGRPIQFSIKDLICAIRAYFVSAIFVCVFCLYICTYWLPLKELIESLSVIHRIVMISCIASFLFILLVTIIEGSFNSIRNILSLVRIFLSRRES